MSTPSHTDRIPGGWRQRQSKSSSSRTDKQNNIHNKNERGVCICMAYRYEKVRAAEEAGGGGDERGLTEAMIMICDDVLMMCDDVLLMSNRLIRK